MKITGIDSDTKALSLVTLDTEDTSVAWAHNPIKGQRAENRFPGLMECYHAWATAVSLQFVVQGHFVYLERPMLVRRGKFSNVAAYGDQMQVVGGIRTILDKLQIPYTTVDPAIWKKVVMGNGSASKEDIVQWVQAARLDAWAGKVKKDVQDLYDAAAIAAYGRLVMRGK